MSLSAAANDGDLARVTQLIEQGADKNQVDSNGWTPVYAATRKCHIAVVRYLVEQGADMEKADRDGSHDCC